MQTPEQKEELAERLEHRDVLLNIQAILSTEPGRGFFKYLFKNFEVGEMPQIGLEGPFLMDRLGFLRAGNSIFKLAAEANAEIAAGLLAQNEKERYAKIYASSSNGQS